MTSDFIVKKYIARFELTSV